MLSKSLFSSMLSMRGCLLLGSAIWASACSKPTQNSSREMASESDLDGAQLDAPDSDASDSDVLEIDRTRSSPYLWLASSANANLPHSRTAEAADRQVQMAFADRSEGKRFLSSTKRLADGRIDVSEGVNSLRVALAERGDQFSYLASTVGGLTVGLRLQGAASTELESSSHGFVYPNANGEGNHQMVRVTPDHFEDFVVLRQAATDNSMTYQVDVSRVAGVRLVEGSEIVEFLDHAGVPRMHIQPPLLRDSEGHSIEVHVSIDGCTVDVDPRPSFDRTFTRLREDTCAIRLHWSESAEISYPAVLDPAWTATGLMGSPRYGHIAELLNDGRVLVAGGWAVNWSVDTTLRATEVYDPALDVWTTVGSLRIARASHGGAKLTRGPRSGQVMVFGGGNNFFHGQGARSSTEFYNPATSTWSDGPRMAFARIRGRHVSLSDGRILIDGGRGSKAFPSLTDSDGTVNVGCGSSTCICGNEATWPGVKDGSGDPLPSECPGYSSEIYDPDSNTIAVLPGTHVFGRDNHNVEQVDAQTVLAFASNTSTSYRMERLDLTTGLWTLLPASSNIPFGGTRNQIENAPARMLPTGQIMLIETGKNGDPGTETALWNPATQTWVLSDDQPSRDYFMSTQSSTNSGSVLLSATETYWAAKIAGNEGQIFDLNTGVFRPYGGPQLFSHFFGTTTALADGRILLSGGEEVPSGAAHDRAEIISECTSNSDCSAPTGICASCNRCVECTNNTQCPASRPICDLSSNTCVQCEDSSQCTSGSNNRCDVFSKTCMSEFSTLTTSVCSYCQTACKAGDDRPWLGLGRDPQTRHSSNLVVDTVLQGISVRCGSNSCM